jgi:hypothetical protein
MLRRRGLLWAWLIGSALWISWTGTVLIPTNVRGEFGSLANFSVWLSMFVTLVGIPLAGLLLGWALIAIVGAARRHS